MERTIPGLHHVTAISGRPQDNLDFYTGLLGQRLVKRTVNFDDPGTYHLYYGDRSGTPGTVLTFFPFPGAGRGRSGAGAASATAYAVPQGALPFWIERLRQRGASTQEAEERFGERVLALSDPHGLTLELVETIEQASRETPDSDVPPEAALGGFHSVTLSLADVEPTARLMTDILGFEEAGEDATGVQRRLRLRAPGQKAAAIVDLLAEADGASVAPGTGTVHHIAFRAPDEEELRAWRESLEAAGLRVTPVLDRQYFRSIYFREPGGVLFEIATDPPGFSVDEAPAELGTHLRLPPWLETDRANIERRLPKLDATVSRESAVL